MNPERDVWTMVKTVDPTIDMH